MGPIILALESATSVCSVALSKGSEILSLKETVEGNRHSEWMTVYIEECMKEAGVQYSDIQCIAVSKGPGSYTGLRVGYSIAKGLAYQLDVPIVEVNTIRSIAFGLQESVSEGDLIIPMVDARRMEVYMQYLDHSKKELTNVAPCILDEKDWNDLKEYRHIHLVGNGAWKCKNLEPFTVLENVTIHEDVLNSAKFLLPEAIELWNQQVFADVAYCVPFYLKSPNITKSKKPLF